MFETRILAPMRIKFIAAFLLLLLSSAPGFPQQNPQPTGEIVGKVVSSRDNESLALVQIELQGTMYRAVTDDEGKFRLANVPAGSYVLQVSSVGYYVLREPFTLGSGETKSFDIVLASSNSTLTNTVDVSADPFQLDAEESVASFTLQGDERKNLASVLADDPLRAVQSLPGVTSNNDFSSEFSIRGASFSRIGLYLDSVLLHSPVHTTDGQADNGSLTIFNGDLTQDMTLYQGGWPVRYANRTAGVLAVESREGSREKIQGNVSASASNSGVTLEGPWSSKKKGSWLVSFRKSYLQYILNRIDFGDQAPIAFGFMDGQARLSYDLSAKHTVSFTYLDGTSDVDRRRFRDELGPNTLMASAFRFTFLNAGSRYSPSSRLLISNHVSWARERGNTSNRDDSPLSDQHYQEWTWHGDSELMWNKKSTLEFGGEFRHVRQEDAEHQLVYTPTLVSAPDLSHGSGNGGGAYAQESFDIAAAHTHLAVGVREDKNSATRIDIASPYASLSLQPLKETRLEFSWGQYSQYPELNQTLSTYALTGLLPERATHYEAAVEQRLNERTRLRLELYDRQDRDLLARPALFPRLLSNGTVAAADPRAAWVNSERGYSRGLQVFVQRRSANGFTGWVSYAYGRTMVHDGVLDQAFPADYDQRHTFNAYVSRRVRPTVNVSARFTYGSGMPLPGFYDLVPGGYAVAQVRNGLRAPSYERTDLRLNKAYVRTRFKTTLYGEIVNITNHRNRDFDTPGPYDLVSHRSFPNFYSMFPILPSAGVVLEF
jgi:hypothetical protein